MQTPNPTAIKRSNGIRGNHVPGWRGVLIFVSAALLAALNGSAQTVAPGSTPVLYYIPHTHWEGAVFKTRDEYLDVGLPHILQALRLLKQYPDYKFTLDQVAYFRPFLERYPEEADAFRKFVAEGRLEIVGGMDVMPDVVKPGGELFIRQMLYGKGYCREHLGVEVTVAWLLDTFGHHPQMPQLLRQAGFESFWFCRGVPRNNLPSEFLWQGIDGTTIPAFWLPGFYGLFYGPPQELPQFAQFFERRFDSLTPHTRFRERVGLAGVDVSEPEEFVPPLVAAFNRQPEAPFTIRFSVPSEFVRVVAQRPNPPVITNEFSPIFQGTYSSRIELKQITRDVEQRLLRAENFLALAHWLDAPVDDSPLWRGWEPVLFNQTHDLASGVMTDHVYEDTARSYDFSQRLATGMIDQGWEALTTRIDTRGEGIPVVVFNPLGWPRTDIAEVEVGFSERGIRDVSLTGASGAAAPVQIVHADRDRDGGIMLARLAFVAADVPALGCATYHVMALRSPGAGGSETHEEKGTSFIENDFFRASFDLANGSMTNLLDKSLQWQALAGPANVVAREADKGDLWELYRGLDGGSYVAMTNRQAVPTQGEAQLSTAYSDKPGIIRRGPVYSEFSVEHPCAGSGFASRVRLYAGMRRIDFQTELVNHEKYVRYRVLFPTSIREGYNTQEIPFGAIERPSGIEFPAQHWIDVGDGQRGVALLNFGLPGNTVTDGTLMLSLLRSHNLGAYGFGGGYEPGMSSESGFELGNRVTFQYALVPHGGDWREAEIYRAGFEFNHPLIARKVAPHAGTLPGRWGFLEVSHPNIALTAFKPGPDRSTVLRLYETAGKATAGVTIKFHGQITDAREANLLEDSGRGLAVAEEAIRLEFHPFEIKTLKVHLAQQR
jgi:alpha-mannosidase